MSILNTLKQDTELYEYLVERIGKAHLRRRIGIESEHVADQFGQGRTFLHIENWRSAAAIIQLLIKLSGMASRGKHNVLEFQVRHNRVTLANLPSAFEGFTLLHLSDLHLDSLDKFPKVLADKISTLQFDVCVLTGDYRFLTYGPYTNAIRGLDKVCSVINKDIYAILGNHDTILMTRAIESLGIQLLLNENVAIERDGETLWLAGIDDPHYFSTDNLEKAYHGIADESVSLLLSHSPEIYRHAAYVGFDFMMCGHTHGGQICLPGGYALTFNSAAPRFTGAGAWTYDLMQGYTSAGTGSSVVAARFNCPPEITLHHLHKTCI